MASERTGKIQTVLGLIDPADLGITLTHEHLLVDLRCHWFSPEEASEREWIDKPVTLDRLGGVTSRFYNLDSMILLDEAMAVEETFKYKLAGGGSLVDVTSIGIGRDPLALARIARAPDEADRARVSPLRHLPRDVHCDVQHVEHEVPRHVVRRIDQDCRVPEVDHCGKEQHEIVRLVLVKLDA